MPGFFGMSDSSDPHADRFPGVLGVSRAAPGKLLDKLAVLGTENTLRKGQDLFRQGDEADALYVLRDGLLEISTLSGDGRRLAHILLKPGTVFGEIALFDGGRRSATVTAKAHSRLLKVRESRLLEELRNNPDLAIDLLHLTIGRLRWMSEELHDYAFQPVGVRLARRLVYLLQTVGKDGAIRIGQGELAEHIGATRETVSKSLTALKERGIVEIGRGRIKVRDLDALCELGAPGVV